MRTFLLILGILLFTIPILAGQAYPHDAIPTAATPKGWSYPSTCCSNKDCREVSAKSIGTNSQGYVIKATGEVVGYLDTRIKESPDGRYHWCSESGLEDSRTICLYVPPPAY